MEQDVNTNSESQIWYYIKLSVKIKTKLGLNSKLINYKNIFIFIIDLRTVLVIPNRVLENLQDKEQFFKVLNNS